MIYFSDFSGPTGPVDPDFSDVVLLLGFEGSDGATTTSDESDANNGAATFHNQAQIDTAQSKFGGSSLLLDGSDKIVFGDDPDWHLPADWTIEMWVRFASTGGFQTLIAQANTSGAGTMLDAVGGTILRLRYKLGTSGQQNNQYTWNYSTDTWYHVVAERSGNDFRLYADGVMLGKASSAEVGVNETLDLTIGAMTEAASGVTNGFNGWIDELRITKGVARYGSDSGYTIPTEAFPRQ